MQLRLKMFLATATIAALFATNAVAQEAKELQCVMFGKINWYVKIDYERRQLVLGIFSPGQAPDTFVLPANFTQNTIHATRTQNGYAVASFIFDRYAGTLMIVDYDPHVENTTPPCEPYRVQQRKY